MVGTFDRNMDYMFYGTTNYDQNLLPWLNKTPLMKLAHTTNMYVGSKIRDGYM